MKDFEHALQEKVLQRLETGQMPTRWQQFQLHVLTAARHLGHLSCHQTAYHFSGLLRIFMN